MILDLVGIRDDIRHGCYVHESLDCYVLLQNIQPSVDALDCAVPSHWILDNNNCRHFGCLSTASLFLVGIY